MWDDDERSLAGPISSPPAHSPIHPHTVRALDNIHKDILKDVNALTWDEIEFVDYNYELLAAEYMQLQNTPMMNEADPFNISFNTQDNSDEESYSYSEVDNIAEAMPNAITHVDSTLHPDADDGSRVQSPDLLDRLVKNTSMYT